MNTRVDIVAVCYCRDELRTRLMTEVRVGIVNIKGLFIDSAAMRVGYTHQRTDDILIVPLTFLLMILPTSKSQPSTTNLNQAFPPKILR